MIASRLLSVSLLSLAPLPALPVSAQEVVQALPGTTDADALAADMRALAANPRDVDALVDAARLSLRLDDIRAAAALLQRAENVNPRDPRVKAGQGSVLVQSERPGQALRYFAEAEAYGLDPGSFGADRGLAYDLTGQQERAQRDYARALRTAPNDGELIRRYALSLGISGQRQRALALLDPLVRRSDRAAWRSQAFVLAMTGDLVGAQRIAATMMPGGASGLSAFFQRLPTLPATDRAFAVHFGEVRPSPERLADARLAPPVAPLPREPVVLASVRPPATPPRATRNRRDPFATPGSAVPIVTSTLLVPPRAPSTLPRIAATRPPSEAVSSVLSATAPAPAVRPPTSPVSATVAATTPLPAAPAQLAAAVPVSILPSAPVSRPTAVLSATREAGTEMIVSTSSTDGVTTVAAAAPPDALAVPAPAGVASAAPPTPVAIPRPAPRPAFGARVSEDSILAKIIAGLSIPGSELGVAEPERPAPVIAPPPPVPAPGRVEPATSRAEPVAEAVAEPAPQKVVIDRAAADTLAAARVAADKRAAERKAAADKKALADKKAAAEKKALADKADREAAEQRRIERSNPERIWVQVAGGAYEGDLPKAYASVKARASAVFGTRGGYTTPLRATNRVLTGPFKTDAEARAFVNDLKKAGISAFTFTSDAGQPVNKLGSRGKADDDQPEAKDDVKASAPRSKRRR